MTTTTTTEGSTMKDARTFIQIDSDYALTDGTIPAGTDLVVMDQADVISESYESALNLYGFDDLGCFILCRYSFGFSNPVYGFLGRLPGACPW